MEIKDLKTGAARIAHAAGVPLVPVVVWGTQRMMTKDHPRDFSRGKAITVCVGAPVPLTGDAVADTAALEGLAERAARRARSATYPQHEPGAWWVPASYGGTAPTLDRGGPARRRGDAAPRAARRAAR